MSGELCFGTSLWDERGFAQNLKLPYAMYHECRCAATQLQTPVNAVLWWQAGEDRGGEEMPESPWTPTTLCQDTHIL